MNDMFVVWDDINVASFDFPALWMTIHAGGAACPVMHF
jgi:uncharacterized protein YfaA (DUF2138 family)